MKSLRSQFISRQKENPDASTLVSFVHVLYSNAYSGEEKLESLDLIRQSDYKGKKLESIKFIMSI